MEEVMNPTPETLETVEVSENLETLEPVAVEEPVAAEEETSFPTTRAEVVERLKAYVEEGAAGVDAQTLSRLKAVYYAEHNAIVAEAREAFLAEGGEAEAFEAPADEMEETFKATLALVRELRAKAAEAAEAEKQQNLTRKKEIIEALKAYGENPEEADKHYDEVKALMAEWRGLGAVPAEEATALWKNYQLYADQYYDQLRLNHEMRAYDLKKNLEIKSKLVESAEALVGEEDVLAAFRQLQALHAEWRETGPVARELREELWARFKEASTAINKRHQAHFEEIKAAEEENYQRKQNLCERAEAVSVEGLKTHAQWEERAAEVQALQSEWKEIGFAPRKVNQAVYDRFRAACNAFFEARNAFMHALRDELHANLEKKEALCQRAEALQESDAWGKTMNELVQLQKEWKTIGPAPRKVSDALWHRFNTACNTFFRRRHEATAEQRAAEQTALEAKRSIIEQLEALLTSGEEAIVEKARELQDAWQAAGHVPFRLKEELYQQYRAALDRIYTEHRAAARRQRQEGFRRNLEQQGPETLQRKRQRLLQDIEQKQQEITTYETNLSFFTSKSKGANALLNDAEKKIARLKEDLEALREQLKAVREQIKAEEAEQQQV